MKNLIAGLVLLSSVATFAETQECTQAKMEYGQAVQQLRNDYRSGNLTRSEYAQALIYEQEILAILCETDKQIIQ